MPITTNARPQWGTESLDARAMQRLREYFDQQSVIEREAMRGRFWTVPVMDDITMVDLGPQTTVRPSASVQFVYPGGPSPKKRFMRQGASTSLTRDIEYWTDMNQKRRHINSMTKKQLETAIKQIEDDWGCMGQRNKLVSLKRVLKEKHYAIQSRR